VSVFCLTVSLCNAGSSLLGILNGNGVEDENFIFSLGRSEQFLNDQRQPERRTVPRLTKRRMLLIALFMSLRERPGMAASIWAKVMACAMSAHTFHGYRDHTDLLLRGHDLVVHLLLGARERGGHDGSVELGSCRQAKEGVCAAELSLSTREHESSMLGVATGSLGR